MSERLAVFKVEYSIHNPRKRGGARKRRRPSLRVLYDCGDTILRFCEWVCFEHGGYARKKAEEWWAIRSDLPTPATVDEAYRIAMHGLLREPVEIAIDHKDAGDDFFYIVDVEFPAIKPVGVTRES